MMDYPLWLVDLDIYEPGDKDVELAEILLDFKESVKLRRVYKSVFSYISIKD